MTDCPVVAIGMSERRITAVVVDVVETLFSLDAVEALDQAGAGALPEQEAYAGGRRLVVSG